jgi:hypothetical protein
MSVVCKRVWSVRLLDCATDEMVREKRSELEVSFYTHQKAGGLDIVIARAQLQATEMW